MPPTTPDAAALPPLEAAHSDELLQLSRLLRGKTRFVLVFLEYGERRYRDAVIQRLTKMGHAGEGLLMQPEWVSSGPILDALTALPATCQVVHLLELGAWLRLEQGSRFCGLLNFMREALAEAAARPLLLWLGPSEIRALAIEAPDLWSWRSTVLTFSRPDTSPRETILPTLSYVQRLNLDHDVAQQRIKTMDDYLASNPNPSWAVASLWQERGELCRQLGAWDAALADLHKARALFEAQNDPHTASQVARDIADVLIWRGELERARCLLRDEVLPLFKKLNDNRAYALTLCEIAAIHQTQGEFDEALRIFTEQLPVFDKIGDGRSHATTMLKIANIHQQQGKFDEALRIYTAQLTVFDKIGDGRAHATTMANIGNINRERGELDEALRLYKEQISIFEKVGDSHNLAIARSNIAMIHQQRGELDEALRLYKEQRPIFAKLGDSYNLAVIQQRIAKIENPGEAV